VVGVLRAQEVEPLAKGCVYNTIPTALYARLHVDRLKEEQARPSFDTRLAAMRRHTAVRLLGESKSRPEVQGTG
jgi:hypothetical protein